MAQAFDDWARRQETINLVDRFDTPSAVRQFLEQWLNMPFRQQEGGSRFNNLLWLFLLAKAFNPTVIVDSGTYRGGSAWALAAGAPAARVLSFDIDLSHLAFACPLVTYLSKDWTEYPLGVSSDDRILVYFDDHVDQVRRLLEAAQRGCHVAIFDDDFPVTAFHAMAPNNDVLPKIEFALDRDLVDGQVLRWISRGKELSWVVDREYLDSALSVIHATERLPNTSLISGIHQTPYRIVSLKSPLGIGECA